MLNGKIIRNSREIVKGTHKMHAWSDEWDESFDIEFDGELTEEVCAKIVSAFKASNLHTSSSGSSWGALRWPLADSNIHVNVEDRQLIVTRGTGICD